MGGAGAAEKVAGILGVRSFVLAASMNGNDWQLGLICVGMPALIGLFGWWIWKLSVWARNFACPACGGTIAKSAIGLHGVRCPHCDWQATDSAT